MLALKLDKKIIVHPMGFYEPWSFSQKKIKKKIALHLYQKKILLKADLIHCASHNEKKNIYNLRGQRSENLKENVASLFCKILQRREVG